ncbi:MAG: CoA transferase [Sphingomonadales bacterium]|nr:CoA transferase [Sphingomonadales bacterium]
MYPLLSGLRVIEASSFVASPTAGLYLAQMGAEVIRVDQIGGGPDFKRWPKASNGSSLYWENLNRAKKSVALNLGTPEGRELLQALVAATGQFVTNFPVDGFLAHETLSAKRADLITVRIMGLADGDPALDYTVNSAVGFPDLTGPGPEPVNHVLPAWDLLTGAYAAFAMLAALRHRDTTGRGKEVRIPLSDVAIGTVANLGMLAEIFSTGANRERLGNTVYGAFGRDFVTADNIRLMIMAITPRQWTGLVNVLGISGEVAVIESAHGVSFAKDEGVRFQHRDALFPLVESKVSGWIYEDLKSAFDANGCCYGPYQSMKQAVHDPVLVGNNPMFGSAGNPSGMDYPAAGTIASIPQLERQAVRSAPLLGQHSDEVLAEVLGLSSGALAALHDKGIIAQA